MDYSKPLKYHYRPKKGWVNDPNGLVYYKGYYHVFYQHAPNHEIPWKEPMHWGHARTKDFLSWEELPIALFPDKEYDAGGCWSGTAIVKDDILYLIYSSVVDNGEGNPKTQTVSVAFSDDGINFTKYEHNPVLVGAPPDGNDKDFRDPAVTYINGTYYCVMASGHEPTQTANLLLYKSDDMFNWEYCGVMAEWENGICAECPSFASAEDKFLLTASVLSRDTNHYFSLMFGSFENGKFKLEHIAKTYKGPDQYAGQMFKDDKGRNILIAWMPGWSYQGYVERDIGCMSAPCEIKLVGDKICVYPVEEIQHLLKDNDPALTRTSDGFLIEREGREAVVHKGEINDIKMIRDEYFLEVFVNGGENVYSVLL